MGICITNECVEKYLEKLENGIAEYMQMPISQRSSEAVQSMIEAWEHVKAMQEMIENKFEFTKDTAKEWCDNMINTDGTTGSHWTMNETESFRTIDVQDYIWNVAMNMMYSDYYDVAVAYGANIPEFYAEMAKAFLEDEDAKGPVKKISAYHACIAT